MNPSQPTRLLLQAGLKLLQRLALALVLGELRLRICQRHQQLLELLRRLLRLVCLVVQQGNSCELCYPASVESLLVLSAYTAAQLTLLPLLVL